MGEEGLHPSPYNLNQITYKVIGNVMEWRHSPGAPTPQGEEIQEARDILQDLRVLQHNSLIYEEVKRKILRS